jgi:hypothetical protein
MERPQKILFLCHRVPFPPDKGDRIRSYQVLNTLAELGHVYLGFVADEQLDVKTRGYLALKCERVCAPRIGPFLRWSRAALHFLGGKSLTEGLFEAPQLREQLDRWGAESPFDAVVCFSSSMLPYLRGRGLEDRTVVDLVDADSEKWLDYAGHARAPLSWLFRREANRVQMLEEEARAA